MTKQGEQRKKRSARICDDPIWKLINSINTEFTKNHGWYYSDGLFYVMGHDGTRIYTQEEFSKIIGIFDRDGA